jgi:hypothetical protein
MMDRDPESRWSMADAAHGLRRLADRHSPERTRENTVREPATTRVPAPVVLPERDDPPPSAAPSSAPPRREPSRPRRRGPVYAVLGLLALLVVLGGVAYAASLRDDTSPRDTAGSSSPSSSPSKTASDTPAPQHSSSQGPTRSASATGAADGTGVAAEKAFLGDYFRKAPGGTDEGWALLTPRYQAEVGRGSYNGFWSTIESVDVGRVSDAGGNTVDATLTYTRKDGSTTTEQHQLSLVRSGNGYLIDGDN